VTTNHQSILPDPERAAFETWASKCRDLECDHGQVNLRYLGLHKTYVDFEIHRAWTVWQAARAGVSTPALTDEQIVAGYRAMLDCIEFVGPEEAAKRFRAAVAA
jgi:hypothetical protein